MQRYLNFHYSVSLDLFGAETSTNAANYFAPGLKGRFQEERRDDDHRLHDVSASRCPPSTTARIGERGGRRSSALNETLRDDYIADCAKGVDRWNRTLAEVGVELRPARTSDSTARSARSETQRVSPDGQLVDEAEWAANVADVAADRRTTSPSCDRSCSRSPSRGRWRAGSRRRRPASTASRSTSSTSGSPDQTNWGMTSSMNSLDAASSLLRFKLHVAGWQLQHEVVASTLGRVQLDD